MYDNGQCRTFSQPFVGCSRAAQQATEAAVAAICLIETAMVLWYNGRCEQGNSNCAWLKSILHSGGTMAGVNRETAIVHG